MAKSASETKELDFSPGDTVVEPTIGICQVEGVRTITVDGGTEEFFIFTSGKAKVMVPRSQLFKRGIRHPMSRETVKKVLGLLKTPIVSTRGEDARQNYLNYRDVLKSGDPLKICKLIRELYSSDEKDELKGKEKEIMEQALVFLVDEILFVTDESKTKVRRDVDECLEKMYKKKVDKEAEKTAATKGAAPKGGAKAAAPKAAGKKN